MLRGYSFINLFHFDMPMTMQQAGGWESRDVVEAYAEYAQTCFRLLAIGHWFWLAPAGGRRLLVARAAATAARSMFSPGAVDAPEDRFCRPAGTLSRRAGGG